MAKEENPVWNINVYTDEIQEWMEAFNPRIRENSRGKYIQLTSEDKEGVELKLKSEGMRYKSYPARTRQYNRTKQPVERAKGKEPVAKGANKEKKEGFKPEIKKPGEERPRDIKELLKLFASKIYNGLLVIVAYGSALIGTFLRNLLLNQREQVDLSKSVADATARREYKKETEKEEEKEETEKAQEALTQNQEEELSDDIKKEIAQNKTVKDIFSACGLKLREKNGQFVVITDAAINNDSETVSVYKINPAEILAGDAKSMASAIFHQENNTDSIQMQIMYDAGKVEASVRALIADSMLMNACRKSEYEKEVAGGELPVYSYVHAKTMAGPLFMKVESTGEPGIANIIINGKTIKEIDLNNADKGYVQSIYAEAKEKSIDYLFDAVKMPHEIGDVTYVKSDEGLTHVAYKGKEIGAWSFESEKDIREMSKLLNDIISQPVKDFNDLNYLPASPEAISYVVASLSNPEIKQEYSEDKVVGTFSGELEEPGAAHMRLVSNSTGIRAYLCSPDNGVMRAMPMYSCLDFQNVTSEDLVDFCTKVDSYKEIMDRNTEIIENYQGRQGTYEEEFQNDSKSFEESSERCGDEEEKEIKEEIKNENEFDEFMGTTNNPSEIEESFKWEPVPVIDNDWEPLGYEK